MNRLVLSCCPVVTLTKSRHFDETLLFSDDKPHVHLHFCLLTLPRRSTVTAMFVSKLARLAPSTPSILTQIARSTSSIIDNDIADDSILLRNDDENGVATLTLNNPVKYNVMTWDMLQLLQNQLDTISKEDRIKVVVIRATGKGENSHA